MRNEQVALLGLTLCTLVLAQAEPALAQVVFTKAETVATGILASGPIFTMMDMATSMSIWLKRGSFQPQATLDLRVDYLRPAEPGKEVFGRGECYHLSRSIAFVRGQAHDGDPERPIAHVAGTYMFTAGV